MKLSVVVNVKMHLQKHDKCECDGNKNQSTAHLIFALLHSLLRSQGTGLDDSSSPVFLQSK